MKNTFTVILTAIGFLFALSGCSIESGSFVPTSHYVYPNSNVTPLGQTSAKISKFSILFPPKFRSEDSEMLFNQALARYPGSDLVLDYKSDTKVTMYPLLILPIQVWKMDVTVTGTAAKMEVGKQDIGKGK